jgi:hypothetical protein
MGKQSYIPTLETINPNARSPVRPCPEDRGTQARTVAATAMNATSSRAHTIVELRVRRREADGSEVSSKISLVDLVGRRVGRLPFHPADPH